MEERFDGFSESITNWESVRDMIDLDFDVEEGVVDPEIPDHTLNPRIHLFSRHDVSLYGTMPKIEQRIYTKCKDCRLIFSPQDILSHKICTEATIPKSRQYSGRKTKSRSGNGRKPPPAFVQKEIEAVDPSRSKKPRRNATRTPTKEFDPDMHCGVMEGVRGPCTRSITCSNHRIQLKKLVPGRSKEVQQLIAERRIAKDLKVVVIPTEVEESETTVSPQEEEVKVKIELPVRLIEPMSPVPQSEPAYSPADPIVADIKPDKVIVSIPDHLDSDLPMYRSHPKPVAFPPFPVRRFGGASLFSNFHLQTQRNDVLKAINDNSRVNDCDAFKFMLRRRSDRKFAGHVVLQYDTAGEVLNGGDSMQENIGFKELS